MLVDRKRPEFYQFNILAARRPDDIEDLKPLIAYCIGVQREARARGVTIPVSEDIARKHPEVVATMGL